VSRDHRKLRVFHDAHNLTLAIYRETKNFPKDEWFGLRLQMRRAAVSTPSNIVKEMRGGPRGTIADSSTSHWGPHANSLTLWLWRSSWNSSLPHLASD
jgi:hypothetical protein